MLLLRAALLCVQRWCWWVVARAGPGRGEGGEAGGCVVCGGSVRLVRKSLTREEARGVAGKTVGEAPPGGRSGGCPLRRLSDDGGECA